MKSKNTICLWFDKDAHDAARFYAATFPDSKVNAVHKAPSDFPGGKEGDVLTVEFTVLGIPCLGLNGGPTFKQSEAFSFQIATENQEETDRYNAIVGNGGQASQCGWCKDRWGLSWQITPRVLMDALAAGGDEARRAFEAMMPMQKIDVATIEAARRGLRGRMISFGHPCDRSPEEGPGTARGHDQENGGDLGIGWKDGLELQGDDEGRLRGIRDCHVERKQRDQLDGELHAKRIALSPRLPRPLPSGDGAEPSLQLGS